MRVENDCRRRSELALSSQRLDSPGWRVKTEKSATALPDEKLLYANQDLRRGVTCKQKAKPVLFHTRRDLCTADASSERLLARAASPSTFPLP